MKASPERVEHRILQQISQGDLPQPEDYESMGVTQEEFGNVIAGMQKKHYIKGGLIDRGISGSAIPSTSLGQVKITPQGQNVLNREREFTEACRSFME